MRQGLEIRKASLPYYKPYIIIDTSNNTIIGHYDTYDQAKRDLNMFANNMKIPHESNIKNKSSPLSSYKQRLDLPIGDKPNPVIIKPGDIGRRKIQL
jgi:uncharacterized cupredoxin-like copper-binding protein